MARPDLEELYRVLMDVRFDFVPRGEVHLRRVYALVKARYPHLCDDKYLCSTNCKGGYNSPEWRHKVRTCIQEMKKLGLVSNGGERGMWVFGPVSDPPADANPTEAIEGRPLLRLHRRKERKPRLVRRKKEDVLAATGRLLCEACDFNFVEVYGPLGEGFAECHHRTPLAQLTGSTKTRLADLAIVCANCHRMLHRRPEHTVEQLRALVQSLRAEKPPAEPGFVPHPTG